MASGSDLETVDNLPLSDMKLLYSAMQSGLWGPIAEYSRAYQMYAMLHHINDTQVAVVAGKKHKSRPVVPFHEVFPTIDEFASLGRAAAKREIKSEEKLALQAAAMFVDDGAPDWLKQIASEP